MHFYTNNEDYEGCTDSWSWDSDAKTRAQGILASFRNFEFSVCIVALHEEHFDAFTWYNIQASKARSGYI